MLEKVDATLLDLEEVCGITLLWLPSRGVVTMTHAHGAVESHARGMMAAHSRGIPSSERWGYGGILPSILLLSVHVQVPPQILVMLVTWLLRRRCIMWGLSASWRSTRPSRGGGLHETGWCALTAFPRITHFLYMNEERALLLLLFSRLFY